MNRHQVLTGAVNAGDSCFAVGCVDGIPFTVYAAGCDIVILASNFQRVQIIPGATHGNIQVGCIDCSTENGKIAASYANQVYIFEPTPLLNQQNPHKLDFQWYQTGCFKIESLVYNLSWNQDGSRLLTGSDSIQLWENSQTENNCTDEITEQDRGNADDHDCWECIWQCKTATPIYHLKFSTDGQYFASAGKADRLVKIWYNIKKPKIGEPSPGSNKVKPEVKYNFVYIAHPRAVTGFSWRRTSKYMPIGSVGNVLLTSCKDNICRLWSESKLPANSLLNMTPKHSGMTEQFAASLHRLEKSRFRRRPKKRKATQPDIPLPSQKREHDLHKDVYQEYRTNGHGLSPVHFHISAAINPIYDIPLLPAISSMSGSGEGSFVVHWLNNKEFQFTLAAENILQEMNKKSELSDTSGSKEDLTESLSGSEDQDADDGLVLDSKITVNDTSNHVQSSSSSGLHDNIPLVDVVSKQTTSGAREQIVPLSQMEALHQSLDGLLREWNENADMVFSIHPVDGSFLVWLVEYLDEYIPCSYRQAQLSFSCRIPLAFPTGDATTMCSNIILYRNNVVYESKMAKKLSESGKGSAADMAKLSPSYSFMHSLAKLKQGGLGSNIVPQRVSMLSKHTNGSLNQWEMGFAENSKFATVLSISHKARCCGHRFRVNHLACHPVLPLLLTTSHHNVPKVEIDPAIAMSRSRSHSFTRRSSSSSIGKSSSSEQDKTLRGSPLSSASDILKSPLDKLNVEMFVDRLGSEINWPDFKSPTGLCSELILWRVDPVGPLSKSGGVKELARINSPLIPAFSNVAWLPTLIPSSSLGPVSNSPSACFVASDGISLRLYQTVIDARSILSEVASSYEQPEAYMSSCSSLNSLVNAGKAGGVIDGFNIVSLQSTARPGCIIELDTLTDAKKNWQSVQFMHVFQEQFIVGPADCNTESNISAPKQSISQFEERFYLIVIEKIKDGSSVLHMWHVELSTQQLTPSGSKDIPEFQIDDSSPDAYSVDSSRSESPLQFQSLPHHSQSTTKLCITSSKVYTQRLDLPQGVEVVSATPAAGHLSSSSIYPACMAPYLISTACSDGQVRFWHCKVSDFPSDVDLLKPGLCVTTASNANIQSDDVFNTRNYLWEEWQLMAQQHNSSAVEVDGRPIAVSCAYNGRFACAYRLTDPQVCDEKKLSLSVAIYECESTGGSKWLQEDVIHLGKVAIPSIQSVSEPKGLEAELLNYKTMKRSSKVENFSQINEDPDNEQSGENCGSTQCSAKQSLMHKRLVQIDWVSKEDGSHILTIAVGQKMMMYAPVSGDLANTPQLKEVHSEKPATFRNPLLAQKSLHVAPTLPLDEEAKPKWVPLRVVELHTADGLPPLPMMMSWVRDGILVVGMENEMHVYSQWKSEESLAEESSDDKSVTDYSVGVSASVQSIPITMAERKEHSSNDTTDSKTAHQTVSKSDDSVNNMIQHCGLFEAAQLTCPVLPQYHPKQLNELMKCGKFNRVKAILAHLVRCIAGEDAATKAVVVGDSEPRPKVHSRSHSQARLSISPSPAEVSILESELNLDYIEMNSIPPLPLYALIEADQWDESMVSEKSTDIKPTMVNGFSNPEENNDDNYSALFSTQNIDDDELVLGSPPRRPEMSREVTARLRNPSYFGYSQARLLTNHLTHVHLPGLTSIDQMHLLALADTIATTRTDLPAGKAGAVMTTGNILGKEGAGYASSGRIDTSGSTGDALDECGLRYLLALRHHVCLIQALPLHQRLHLKQQGLSPSSYAWAFHSEAQEELLALIPAMQRGDPTWPELRTVGVGWWVRSNTTLKTIIEKIAKAQFQADNNPLDAALFYLAMRKKSLVTALFRTVQDTRMTGFFKNDFTQDRWRRAALKNAFALLGKQRFEHAAAFFLLAGALKDAMEVCIDKLGDIQLAMVIARLFEEHLEIPVTQKEILYSNILGCDNNGKRVNSLKVSPDPFLRSIACWMVKDYSKALETLIQHPDKTSSINNSSSVDSDRQGVTDTNTANPDVFNFYNYLRTHPLLLRRQFAGKDREGPSSVLITGFSSIQAADQSYKDEITPLERQLFFRTAHGHFVAGCPLAALEVLSKLPKLQVTDHVTEDKHKPVQHENLENQGMIDTGTISDFGIGQDNAGSFDWGQPVSKTLEQKQKSTLDFDWSQPVGSKFEDKLELTWSDDESETKSDTESAGHDNEKLQENSEEKNALRGALAKTESMESNELDKTIDIMAQQLKFQACLKILMEELRTLATGFEVEGGQLRYQLYVWLEREVEALKNLCNYGSRDIEPTALEPMEFSEQPESRNQHDCHEKRKSKEIKTLHEMLIAERMDLEAKRERADRRKSWLKANQNFLRTLLSYTSLHGSTGGGLPSVKMELILLLQELQQEKTQQQLLSPLPFPTTLPLLSASVASAKTVVADPIVHLRNITHDILHTIIQLTTPPRPGKNLGVVRVLHTLSAALSSCVYQSLCDSDSCSTTKQIRNKGMDVYSGRSHSSMIYRPGHLLGTRKRHMSEENLTVTSPPSKWPGVSSLQALLATERDEDMPKLTIFLYESFFAVYASLLVHALTTNASGELYRLVAHSFDAKLWSAVFGGGGKIPIHVSMPTDESLTEGGKNEDKLAKQRRQLNLRLLGKSAPGSHISTSTAVEEKMSYKEKFVSPEISLIDYFMVKPYVPAIQDTMSYDSDDESNDSDEETPYDEEDDVFTTTTTISTLEEHADYNSYSWCLMRYATVRLVLFKLQGFLPSVGIELAELPVVSPMIHSVMKTLERWQQLLMGKLELFAGPPPDYISYDISSMQTGGPAILRYKAMLEPSNTPFRSNSRSAQSVRRLWNFLVRQEHVQDIFIHYIFKKKPREHETETTDETDGRPHTGKSRILHKENDKISGFTINHANPSCIVVSTPREVAELDLSLMLDPQPLAWIEDRFDDTDSPMSRGQSEDDFVLVHTVEKSASSSTLGSNFGSSSGLTPSGSSSQLLSLTANSLLDQKQTGRESTVLLRRPVQGVRRMTSHPTLPYYLTGSVDGSVQMWEWGHSQKLQQHRTSGNYPKVTRMHFNPQGNKFGVTDDSGQLCLWQIGSLASAGPKPYLRLQCHNKTISDFVFVGSASLLATAGYSSDNKNMCLWDTLLPHRHSLVQAFTCHEGGCPCLVYAPNHQLIISGGKRGDIAIFDMRQRQLRHTFQAHDSEVKCLALDPTEEFFATGSADGDIKVWGLSIHNLLYSFPGEHSRNTLFRGSGGGVIQLTLSPSHNLFSCGADGTMKWRVLPERSSVVNNLL
ncbi:dmX-like protein 2 isoform X2 [Ptychodera flava]|uniref:dmX-like protein 2 isoform X2 n=1 Tax=Ptychodera flava TaxID=63121 RepID=UPI00396A7E79